jgi:hydroxymethylglutaryl-CoA lyase
VKRMFEAIRKMSPDVELACHFHNTFGMGLANSLTALKCGVKYYETSFAGLGGCPFTKSPVGNIATENFVQAIQAKNHRKDINNNILSGMAKIVNYYFKRELPGHAFKF